MKNIKQRFITTGAMALALAMGAMTTVPVFGVNGDKNTAGYVPVTKTVMDPTKVIFSSQVQEP